MARHARGIVLLSAMVLLTAACSHRTSTEELVKANSQVLDGGSPTATTLAGGAVGDGGVSVADDSGTPALGTDGSAAPGASGGGPGGGAPTGSSSGGGTGGAGGAASVSTPSETGPIVIGSVGNYSGLGGPPQAPMAKAVQVWAEYINSKGGIAGRQVQVIVADDRGDPAQHQANLKDLVENRKVVAFVSNAASLTQNAGRSYLESVGVPVIGTTCANTMEYESPVYFPQCATTDTLRTATWAAGKRFADTGGDELGVVTCAEAQACADVRAAATSGGATKAGLRVVYNAQASLAQPDYTSECRGAQGAGAKYMSVVLDPTGVIRFGQSCARQGYNPVYLLGSATAFYNTKDQPGLSDLVVTTAVFSFADSSTPARKEFQDVMKDFYGKPGGPAESYGWTASKLFELAAIKAAGASQSISSKTLIAALRTMSNETLGGLSVPLTFTSGKATPAACAFSTQAKNGGAWQPLNGGKEFCL